MNVPSDSIRNIAQSFSAWTLVRVQIISLDMVFTPCLALRWVGITHQPNRLKRSKGALYGPTWFLCVSSGHGNSTTSGFIPNLLPSFTNPILSEKLIALCIDFYDD